MYYSNTSKKEKKFKDGDYAKINVTGCFYEYPHPVCSNNGNTGMILGASYNSYRNRWYYSIDICDGHWVAEDRLEMSTIEQHKEANLILT